MTDDLLPKRHTSDIPTHFQKRQIDTLDLVTKYIEIHEELDELLKSGFVDLARANYAGNTRYQNFLDLRETNPFVNIDWETSDLIKEKTARADLMRVTSLDSIFDQLDVVGRDHIIALDGTNNQQSDSKTSPEAEQSQRMVLREVEAEEEAERDSDDIVRHQVDQSSNSLQTLATKTAGTGGIESVKNLDKGHKRKHTGHNLDNVLVVGKEVGNLSSAEEKQRSDRHSVWDLVGERSHGGDDGLGSQRNSSEITGQKSEDLEAQELRHDHNEVWDAELDEFLPVGKSFLQSESVPASQWTHLVVGCDENVGGSLEDSLCLQEPLSRLKEDVAWQSEGDDSEVCCGELCAFLIGQDLDQDDLGPDPPANTDNSHDCEDQSGTPLENQAHHFVLACSISLWQERVKRRGQAANNCQCRNVATHRTEGNSCQGLWGNMANGKD
ncbi:hypothetical protein OGAPHI_006553 [Ogataea philodendri]|uniref:Uncharacterized protein n=1 Tax=Ogataea philodendri TaxID=1378263 RepID=A0A9P8NYB2_9ASCO|nr:uncharacterized protein OGAPHI_006553 [Ogataea philodendri]KAH3661702.1 hypothetical protein OGAPHI_006553 [Ogataea philodendri]